MLIEKVVPETSSFRPPVPMKNFLTNMGSQAGPPVKSADFFQQFQGFGTPTTTTTASPSPPSAPNGVEDAHKPDLRFALLAKYRILKERACVKVQEYPPVG